MSTTQQPSPDCPRTPPGRDDFESGFGVNPPGVVKIILALRAALAGCDELYDAHPSACDCDFCYDAAGFRYSLAMFLSVMDCQAFRPVELSAEEKEEVIAEAEKLKAETPVVVPVSTNTTPKVKPGGKRFYWETDGE